MASREVNCDVCYTSEPVAFCNTCKENICQLCLDKHKSTDGVHNIFDMPTTPGIFTNDSTNCTERKKNSFPDTVELCGECKERETYSTASKFCNDCQERLCDKCANTHAVRKATKLHALVTIDEMEPESSAADILCFPCDLRGEKVQAVGFCEICDEHLCQICKTQHMKSKITSTHDLISITDLRKNASGKIICDVCKMIDKNECAVLFCRICQENLCKRCANQHTLRKSTKTHTLKDIEFRKVEKSSVEFNTICDICKEKEDKPLAILFCSECEENLCNFCIDQHRRRNATKSHILSDIQTCKIEIKTETKSKPACDICQENGETRLALKYCDECEENLCQLCIDQHRRRKATLDHILREIDISNTNSEKRIPLCNPCKILDKKTVSLSFCQICNEFLCDSCTNQHKILKASKEHNLFNVRQLNEQIDKDNLSSSDCDLCKCQSRQEKAVLYCEECEISMCQQCSNQHAYSKTTTQHNQLSVVERHIKLLCNKICCELCKKQNKVSEAVFFCNQCEENLCNPCCKLHSVQNATKNHFLTPTQEKETNSEVNNTNGEQESKTDGDTKPSAPVAHDVSTNSITISWKRPQRTLGDVMYYDIRFKEEGESKWRLKSTENADEITILSELKCDTSYQCKVRAVYDAEDGPDSPLSDIIRTKDSLARKIIGKSQKVSDQTQNGKPAIYKIPVEENRFCRNAKSKTRKCIFGKTTKGTPEKTIMVIGATGAGKSTLIDGMMNYILDVSWEDDFRFTVIDLMDEEKNKINDQTKSQTEWITCYKIHCVHGSQICFTLNIIDTPGFGDTRGISRDYEIVDQIRELFNTTGRKGVLTLDAVCFVTQAPLARLSPHMKYIIDSVLSIFGRDMVGNIFALITFADGNTPPVLEALKKADVPIVENFLFNNSALFAQNKQLNEGSLSPMFWKMGRDSFKTFFRHLQNVESRSLQLTAEVLRERKQLETLVQGLRPQIDEGLHKLETLRQESDILNKHRVDIDQNQNFTYQVDKPCTKKVNLEPGIHVTNCLTCNRTCHKSCAYADDKDKIHCSSMSNGYCTVCPKKCIWSVHANNPYRYEFYVEKVNGTYKELKAKYEQAKGDEVKQKGIVQVIKDEFKQLAKHVGQMVEKMRKSINRLGEIALKPNPLSDVQYIDLLIESEKQEKKPGFQARLTMLQKLRKNAELQNQLQGEQFRPFGDIDLDEISDIDGGQNGNKKRKPSNDGLAAKISKFFKPS